MNRLIFFKKNSIIDKNTKVTCKVWFEMEKIKTSISIVNYKGYEDVKACVESILEYSKTNTIDIYIIDNFSQDNSGEKLKEYFKGIENVFVILNKENVGFGKGHNLCIPYIKSKYHAVVNPDILLNCDVFNEITSYLEENNDIAIITPKLKFPNGEEQLVAKKRPTVKRLLARQLPFKFLKKYEDDYLMKNEDLSKIIDVEFCSGCFFVIKTEIFIKMQGFDKDYFMYVEDADITQKALQYGRAVYFPNTYVFHKWNRQTKRSLKHFFMQLYSMFLYFKKWGIKF